MPEKIILRQTGSYPICTIDTEQHYTLDTIHNGKIIDANYDARYLLCLLNSRFLRFLYENSINETGKVFAQVKIIYIDPLPVKKLSIAKQQPFIDVANSIMNSASRRADLIRNFLDLLQSKLPIDKLSKKFQNWPELTFKSFLAELKKKKVKLSLEEEADWMTYFKKRKIEATDLQIEIDRIDREIDQMVYELYGLTEKEIQIVENN